MKTKTENKSVATKNVDATKTDAKNANEISSVLTVKKFIGLSYDKLNAKEQKRFRSSIRRKLFAIIDSYDRLTLSKSINEANSKESFEAFKKFVKEKYTIPLTECENVFKGNGNKKQSFDSYIADFKAYLQKSEKKVKA